MLSFKIDWLGSNQKRTNDERWRKLIIPKFLLDYVELVNKLLESGIQYIC